MDSAKRFTSHRPLAERIEFFSSQYFISDVSFQLDEGDRSGQDHKLFKKRFRLNVRKYAFLGDRL